MDSAVKVLPLGDWPAIDRRYWESCLRSGRLARLNPDTMRRIERGNGRWLLILSVRDLLDEAQRPSDRVTAANVATYIAALRQEGSKPQSIAKRLWQLRAALRAMEPDLDLAWVNLPGARVGQKYQYRYRGRQRQPRPIRDPFQDWPAIDRKLWLAGMAVGDPLDGPSYGTDLAQGTRERFTRVYRLWISFLMDRQRLDPGMLPADRVTRENARGWVHAMAAKRNCSATIRLRLSSLRGVLKIMQPDRDFRWLIAPGAQLSTAPTHARQKLKRFIDSDILFAWGRLMMEGAMLLRTPVRQAQAFRNGLLITMLAARAPRVRSIAALTTTRHVIRQDESYRMVFMEVDIKTRKRLEFDLPPSLTPFIDRYLKEFRPVLLDQNTHDAFWVTQNGHRWTKSSIRHFIYEASKQRFGFVFGPHRFRHSLGSTAPTRDPANPGLASAIMGIDARTLQAHYNLADQTQVASQFLAGLQSDRQRTQRVAHRAFGQNSTDGIVQKRPHEVVNRRRLAAGGDA